MNGEPTGDPRDRKAREAMVAGQLVDRGIRSARVLSAFLEVPRRVFVPDDRASDAYDDHPVHIGSGQTISQPYMVALMTELLELEGSDRVLEIGTGSGYQTAILAMLVREVYSVERIVELSERARLTLQYLDITNVCYSIADGTLGWPEHAPYDAILVAAAAPRVPPSLKPQLAVGGRLVIPVGSPSSQTLTLVTRTADGFETTRTSPCIFVKLIGKEGYKDAEEA